MVPAEEIKALERFQEHSEPVYMFILNHKVTKVFRGVNPIKIAEIAKQELNFYNDLMKGVEVSRRTYELHEPTVDEAEWMKKTCESSVLERQLLVSRRALRQAARKRHRAERLVPNLASLNFVLFWPHCLHAHPELYERWDVNNIIMVGREVVNLTEELARDVLYSGDSPLNEASLHKLLSGPALAICFRLLDTDKDFVSLTRHILYEEIPTYDDTKPPAEQRPRMTAFDYYKTFSPSRQHFIAKRRQELLQRREQAIEQRARRLLEIQRLARQAIKEKLEERAKEKELRRLELLKTGNLKALKEFDEEPEAEIDIEIPKELPDEHVEEPSDVDDDEVHLPPPGLLVPGFYAPLNDVAKTNGLALLFPKIVQEYATPNPEFLPPHVLVMLGISKRHAAIQTIASQRKFIIHMGIFEATTPQDGNHIAYTVKQYDNLALETNSTKHDVTKLVFMLSIEKDLPLLKLMDLSPCHVSFDAISGEEECAMLFPVDYADDYPEFEDFEKNNEE